MKRHFITWNNAVNILTHEGFKLSIKYVVRDGETVMEGTNGVYRISHVGFCEYIAELNPNDLELIPHPATNPVNVVPAIMEARL